MSINENKEPEFEMWFDETTGKWEKIPYTPKPLPLSPSQIKTTRPEEKPILITPEMQPKPVPVPTLENTPTRDELARAAAEQLRVIERALDNAIQNAHLLPAPTTKTWRAHRRSAESDRDFAATVARMAERCDSDATLANLRFHIEENVLTSIENETNSEGSFSRRSPELMEILVTAAYELENLAGKINLRGHLLLALNPAKQKALLEKQRRFIQSDDLPEVFDYTPAFFADRFRCSERHVRARLKDWVNNSRGPQNLREIKGGNRWKLSEEQAVEFEKFYRSQSTKKPKNKP